MNGQRHRVVHNGIIENFRELKAELTAQGHVFESDTDTEAIVHVITDELGKGVTPEAAVRNALKRLQGAFALAIIFAGHDDLMVAARQGSPLAIGSWHRRHVSGLRRHRARTLHRRASSTSRKATGRCCDRSGVEIFDRAGARVERPLVKSVASSLLVDKGNHRHFMAKEIHEQPEVISHTLSNYRRHGGRYCRRVPPLGLDMAQLARVTLSACGTAYYAGLVGKYWIERYGRLPVEIDVASEMRYREPPLGKGGLSLFVPQSGETADTLATLRVRQGRGPDASPRS